MSSAASPLYPSYYSPQYSGQTVPYVTGNNVNQAAQNQRAHTQSTEDELMSQDQALANEYAQQQSGTQQYLNPIMESNASGQGGYAPNEASQIELSDQQKQNIVTGAGISAGTGNAAAVGAAERAAAAAGGNPSALATYRARAAQSQAANAGQAETGAAVAAQQAGSAGAQAVGNAQIGQENVGTGYLANLQAEQGGQAQTEQGLQQGAFGTGTQGTGQAVGQEINATGVPTSTDKLIGAAAGAASAFLADGAPNYMDDGGEDAVVGENGMEAVIENAPKAVVNAASDPVRSHTTFMDDGTAGTQPLSGTQPASGGMPPWLQNMLANQNKPAAAPSPQPGQQDWNKTTPYQQLGTAIGGIGRKLIQPGAPKPAPQLPVMQGGNPAIEAGNAADYMGGAGNLGASDLSGIGAGFAADGRPSGESPESEEYRSDPENSSPMARYLDEQELSSAPAEMMAGGRMGGGFHWADAAPKMIPTPRMQERSGYQPLAYKAKPMLADGSVAEPAGGGVDPAAIANPMAAQGQPVQPGNGMQVGNAKVFDKPTLIHLEKQDMVVPLGYRARAKVRPSAALPALKAGSRRMYGHAA